MGTMEWDKGKVYYEVGSKIEMLFSPQEKICRKFTAGSIATIAE